MKKLKKHRFVHPDPETSLSQGIKKENRAKVTTPQTEELRFAGTDLRKVLWSIALFTVLLLLFYLINLKWDLLTRFGDLLNI